MSDKMAKKKAKKTKGKPTLGVQIEVVKMRTEQLRDQVATLNDVCTALQDTVAKLQDQITHSRSAMWLEIVAIASKKADESQVQMRKFIAHALTCDLP